MYICRCRYVRAVWNAREQTHMRDASICMTVYRGRAAGAVRRGPAIRSVKVVTVIF